MTEPEGSPLHTLRSSRSWTSTLFEGAGTARNAVRDREADLINFDASSYLISASRMIHGWNSWKMRLPSERQREAQLQYSLHAVRPYLPVRVTIVACASKRSTGSRDRSPAYHCQASSFTPNRTPVPTIFSGHADRLHNRWTTMSEPDSHALALSSGLALLGWY